MQTKERIESFEKRIDKSGNCWIWLGRLNQAGFPITTTDKMVDGKRTSITYNVRKEMYEYYIGKQSERTITASCGDNRCCNPEHLQNGDMEARFWKYVDKTGENGCWNWTGHTIARGYGRITDLAGSETTHRFSYKLHKGKIPEGLSVLHKCNNKRCVNPDHLYVGTHNDNMRDMANSNVMKGERNPRTILTEQKVKEIRKLIKERLVKFSTIAERYGVSRSAIVDISNRRTWSWVED